MAVTFNLSDLEFILQQILMAENNAPPVSPHLAFGLREVAGTNNNTVPDQGTFGSADQIFPRLGDPLLQSADPVPVALGGDGTTLTSYTQTGGIVVDADPRLISNLISDQTAANAAALEAQAASTPGTGYIYQTSNLVPNPNYNPALPQDLTNLEFLPNSVALPQVVDASGNLFIPNVTPDAGLSAPFNSWMTFFGQFFDHGLDLVTKGGNGLVLIPLQPDDPLITLGADGIAGTGDEITDPAQQFMVMTRATVVGQQAGADGVFGTSDDVHDAQNTTTPFVDQNQTYSSHPSHQVFLRDYIVGIDGRVHSTGRLLTGADGHSMPTWAEVKANALKLGIILNNTTDLVNIPLVKVDAYGNFIPHPVTGLAQLVTALGGDGKYGTADDVTISAPAGGAITTDGALRIGHAFLNDIAHTANPVNSQTGLFMQADGDNVVNDTDLTDGVGTGVPPVAGQYDDELLNVHYIAGDGRVNENIGLTAVHDVFHSEHNRLLEQTKAMVRAELAGGNQSFALNWVLAGANLADGIQENEWNGERLFQVAKFGTETQYQHLVFEEFARKIAPNIHLFGNNNIVIDPAISAEFAHAVYRFGHSMLDENVNRYQVNKPFLDISGQPTDTDTGIANPLAGTPVMGVDGLPVLNEIGLIDAFLNPLEFASRGASATGEIVLGSVNQVGNEIDEFVTGALRNNLVGLPLDLAAINIARGRDTGVPPINLLRNELFSQTNDTVLKPYASWDEFGQFLKHPGSLINFVAAYGNHATILSATTLADKRAAALDLVAHSVVGSAGFDQDAYDFMHSAGSYVNDTASADAVHATWSTGSVTGLDTVDLWIGGLAEKQNLFGGLLGSTFNFIFETQLENLQDADRLYYLPRIEGMHWGTEIEQNSFAEMIMTNAGVKHLSASIFLTPEYVVEAGTVTDDPSTWLRNPVTGALLVEKLADGTVHFIGDDNFFGNTMVLGGTEGDDRLLAGQADDDTVWGDGGNDWVDGGNGNDFLYGGDGNDIIRDSSGDDVIHGDAGNDDMDGGTGDDIMFGGDGNDLMHGGNSILGDELQGGEGNDIMLGDEGDDALIGNEGDDWLEGGEGGDGLVGDAGAPTGQVPLYAGNDVMDGGAQGDKMQGFSGDDIMLGEGGFDKFLGELGFDWASYEKETSGVDADMTRKLFIPNPGQAAGDAVRDVFTSTEGISGSAFDDILKGENTNRIDPLNELSNTSLIWGLADGFNGNDAGTGKSQDFFAAGIGAPLVAFSDGNIMLGGGGSDTITGDFNRNLGGGGGGGGGVVIPTGGNDIIDGDAYLHVELQGGYQPGSQIIRQINFADGSNDIDRAVYNDIASNYLVTFTDDRGRQTTMNATNIQNNTLIRGDARGFITVAHNPNNGGGAAATVQPDGIDQIRNIERLVFSDGVGGTREIALNIVGNSALFDATPTGTLSITDVTGNIALPAAGDILRIGAGFSSGISDIDGVLLADGTISHAGAGGGAIELSNVQIQWQSTDLINLGWVNIAGATGTFFTPTDFYVGKTLRATITYTDGKGVTESVMTLPTAIINTNGAINTAPIVLAQTSPVGLPDTSAREDVFITNAHAISVPVLSVFSDDTTPANLLNYSAVLEGAIDGVNVDGQPLANAGLVFTITRDGTGAVTGAYVTGTPGPANFAGPINIRVSAADTAGLTVTDSFTINVIAANDGAAPISIQTDGTPQVGETFTALLGADPDSNLLHPSGPAAFQWLRDGAIIVGEKGATFTAKPADLGHVISVRATYVDGQGFSETVTSAPTAAIAPPPGPTPPVVVALAAPISENAGSFSQNLLAGVFDPNGDPVSVVGLDATVVGSLGLHTLVGTGPAPDFTLSGSTLSLTAAGFAKIADLPAGTIETFTFNFGVSDGVTGTTANTFTLAVAGANDAPTGMSVDYLELSENAVGATIGNVTVLDDIGDSHTFSINDARFEIVDLDPSTTHEQLVLRLKTGVSLDHETEPTVALTVNVSDSAGLPSLLNPYHFTISVGNIDEVGTGALDLTGYVAGPASAAVSATSTVADPDLATPVNPTGAVTSFLWQQKVGPNWIDIAGSTNTQASLSNGTFRVTQSYSDGFGGPHDFVSPQTFVVGTSGNELVPALTGTNGADIILGLDGNDTLKGDGGNDTLDGGNGNDSLSGGAGDDTMRGGDGDDIYYVDSSADQAIETNASVATGGSDRVYSTATFALAANVEILLLTGVAAVDGTGNDGANTLVGNDAANTLDGGLGADTMRGGTGNDIFIVDSVGDQVVETNGQGTDLVRSSVTYTLSSHATNGFVENLTLTGNAAINGTGNGLDNVITGNDAANILSGLNGADTLVGNGGNDDLRGGDGSDILSGGAGDDALSGGTGDDQMSGGDGNDIYYIDSAGDQVTETNANAATGGFDRVFSSLSSYSLTDSVEHLFLTGAAVSGTGNTLANVIQGTGGNNIIDGGAGNDQLRGQGGDDTFVFAAGFGNDVVTDFDANPDGSGQDKLDVRAYGLTAASVGTTIVIDTVSSPGDTVIHIGGDSIKLAGVSGTGTSAVTADDFLFA